jgi:hypothetical protein
VPLAIAGLRAVRSDRSEQLLLRAAGISRHSGRHRKLAGWGLPGDRSP